MTPPRTLSADLLFTRAPTLMPQAVFLKVKELLDRRYERLMSYGRFNDTKAER